MGRTEGGGGYFETGGEGILTGGNGYARSGSLESPVSEYINQDDLAVSAAKLYAQLPIVQEAIGGLLVRLAVRGNDVLFWRAQPHALCGVVISPQNRHDTDAPTFEGQY
jgi:hypothetical protein